MQYEIKYNYQGAIGTLYMPLIDEQQLLKEDIVYSARIAVAKFLGTIWERVNLKSFQSINASD